MLIASLVSSAASVTPDKGLIRARCEGPDLGQVRAPSAGPDLGQVRAPSAGPDLEQVQLLSGLKMPALQ